MKFNLQDMIKLHSVLTRELPGKSKDHIRNLAEAIKNELETKDLESRFDPNDRFTRLVQDSITRANHVGTLFRYGGITAQLREYSDLSTFVKKEVAAKTSLLEVSEMRALTKLFLQMKQRVLFITTEEGHLQQWVHNTALAGLVDHAFFVDSSFEGEYDQRDKTALAHLVKKCAYVVVLYKSSDPTVIERYVNTIDNNAEVLRLKHVHIELVC